MEHYHLGFRDPIDNYEEFTRRLNIIEPFTANVTKESVMAAIAAIVGRG